MSGIANAKALVEMYRPRGVALVNTPSGPQFMGCRNLTKEQKRVLFDIPKSTLLAVLRWQG